MWMVKWVSTDEIFNYYPCEKIFTDYDTARNLQSEMEEELEKQIDRVEDIFEGKILSEIFIEEIKFEDKLNHKIFHIDELLRCKKCNETVNRVVARTSVEVELVWNNAESMYEVAEEKYDLEESTTVFCPACMSDLLKQK